MADVSKFLGKVGVVLGNNFVLLLIATGLSVLVVPRISDSLNKGKLVQEQRQRIVREIVERGLQVESQVNTIYTTFDLFQRYTDVLSDTEYEREMAELRRLVLQHYTEFNRNAWWWIRKVEWDADLLEGFKEKSEHLKKLSNEYVDLLGKTNSSLGPLANRVLRDRVQRNIDPKKRSKEQDDDRALANKVYGELAEIGQRRRDKIGQLTSLFR